MATALAETDELRGSGWQADRLNANAARPSNMVDRMRGRLSDCCRQCRRITLKYKVM
jgi:hypothetical protein